MFVQPSFSQFLKFIDEIFFLLTEKKIKDDKNTLHFQREWVLKMPFYDDLIVTIKH